MKTCPNCAATGLPDTAKMCGHCGSRLEPTEVSPENNTVTADEAVGTGREPLSKAEGRHERSRDAALNPDPQTAPAHTSVSPTSADTTRGWPQALGVLSAVAIGLSGSFEWFASGYRFDGVTGFAYEWVDPFQGDPPDSVETVSAGLVLLLLGGLGVVLASRRSTLSVLVGLGAIATGGVFAYESLFDNRSGNFDPAIGPFVALFAGVGLIVAASGFLRDRRRSDT